MTATDILARLQLLGSAQTKKILIKHGAKEPVFGVKVEDLKKIHKTEKGNNKLAMELFQTGNCDAMYLAGKIGPVKVEMHDTTCKVPSPKDYIEKVSKMGKTGQKRKTLKC